MTSPVLEAASYRMAHYYLDKLRLAEATYQRGHEHCDYALAQFDLDWPQIQRWHEWAANRMDTGDRASALNASPLSIAYGQASEEIVRLRLSPRDRIAWLQAGLSAASALDDTVSMACHMYLIAIAYNDIGDLPQAETFARQASAHLHDGDDPLTAARIWFLLGHIHRLGGKFSEAQTSFETSLAMFRRLGDHRQTGRVLNGLGLVAWHTREIDAAHTLLTESLEIAREVGSESDICDSLLDLSLIYWTRQDEATATALIQECISRCKAAGNNRVLASSLNTYGVQEQEMGRLEDAIEYFRQAIDICRDNGVTWMLGNCLANMGFALVQLNRFDEALRYTLDAVGLARAEKRTPQLAYALSVLVEIYAGLNDIESACEAMLDTLDATRQIDAPIWRQYAVIAGLSLWDRSGKTERAVEWAGMLLNDPDTRWDDKIDVEKFCAKVEPWLGTASVAAALERGKSLTLDGVIDEIRKELEPA